MPTEDIERIVKVLIGTFLIVSIYRFLGDAL